MGIKLAKEGSGTLREKRRRIPRLEVPTEFCLPFFIEEATKFQSNQIRDPKKETVVRKWHIRIVDSTGESPIIDML